MFNASVTEAEPESKYFYNFIIKLIKFDSAI